MVILGGWVLLVSEVPQYISLHTPASDKGVFLVLTGVRGARTWHTSTSCSTRPWPTYPTPARLIRTELVPILLSSEYGTYKIHDTLAFRQKSLIFFLIDSLGHKVSRL